MTSSRVSWNFDDGQFDVGSNDGEQVEVSGEHQGVVRLIIKGDIVECLIIFNNTQLERKRKRKLSMGCS